MSSINIGNHSPSTRNLRCPKFLHIPLLGRICGYSKVGCYEAKASQYGPIQPLPFWCSDNGDGDIQNTFASVVRAGDIFEESVFWKSILPETSQIYMAVMLNP